jgi:hypothetical protein
VNRPSPRLLTFTLLGAALILGSVLAQAGTASAPRTAKSARRVTVSRAAKVAPAQAGMRIYRDPETGTIGGVGTLPAIATYGLPSVEDAPVNLPIVTLPDGSLMMDLQGYFQDYAVMTLDAKGHRVMTCTPHPRAALKGVPSVPARPEK